MQSRGVFQPWAILRPRSPDTPSSLPGGSRGKCSQSGIATGEERMKPKIGTPEGVVPPKPTTPQGARASIGDPSRVPPPQPIDDPRERITTAVESPSCPVITHRPHLPDPISKTCDARPSDKGPRPPARSHCCVGIGHPVARPPQPANLTTGCGCLDWEKIAPCG